jgi:hypothetical protein
MIYALFSALKAMKKNYMIGMLAVLLGLVLLVKFGSAVFAQSETPDAITPLPSPSVPAGPRPTATVTPLQTTPVPTVTITPLPSASPLGTQPQTTNTATPTPLPSATPSGTQPRTTNTVTPTPTPDK